MREMLSKIWYYGTLPIYWFFVFMTSDVLIKLFSAGIILGAFMFLMTWRTTYYWLLFMFVCICCAVTLWLAGVFYGFIGQFIVRMIRWVQGVIDGVDYSKYDA